MSFESRNAHDLVKHSFAMTYASVSVRVRWHLWGCSITGTWLVVP